MNDHCSFPIHEINVLSSSAAANAGAAVMDCACPVYDRPDDHSITIRAASDDPEEKEIWWNSASPQGLAECRICQEEEEIFNLEVPCACSGSVKFAHRKCVQRWCNEKGDTTCEICHQTYKSGYTALPRPTSVDPRYNDNEDEMGDSSILMGQNFVDVDYDDFSEINSNTAACCRSAAFILLVLLLLRHALSIAAATIDEDSSVFFILFLLRAAGFLLPCYIMARAMNILQLRRQRHQAEEAMTTRGVAVVSEGQGRSVRFSMAAIPRTNATQ